MTAADIRSRMRLGALTADQALQLVDAELEQGESTSLWLLRGALIQLSGTGEYSLANARASYERALVLAPESPEPYEELGHFYDAVEPTPQLAMHYYREALARGAGESCREALQALVHEAAGPGGPAAEQGDEADEA